MAYLDDLLKLLQIPQLGPQRIGKLLSEVDFAVFCQYGKAELKYIGWNEKQIQRWFHPDERWIDLAKSWQDPTACQWIVTLFDEDYPFLLRQISTAPPAIFVKGRRESLSIPQIAMVGSRDYSHYGEYWAKFFAAELVKHQLAITSGLAIGIDGFCHQAVIENQGTTIAVLGSGLNHIYPSRHKKLAERIVDTGGALVSEFFPNQPPLAENFPRRNRIISGLSLGTLVVEATINSGSLITACYAMEQGREVFALPNAVQNPYSQGCHKLIKQGALLVESVDDILDSIAYQYQNGKQTRMLFQDKLGQQAVSFEEKLATQLPVSPASTLSELQQRLFQQIGLEPMSIDDLAKGGEMNIEVALVEMLGLELLGVVKQVNGGYVRV